jgi:hypothetical protein
MSINLSRPLKSEEIQKKNSNCKENKLILPIGFESRSLLALRDGIC